MEEHALAERSRAVYLQSCENELFELEEALVNICPTIKNLISGHKRTAFRNALGGQFSRHGNHLIMKREGRILATLVTDTDAEAIILLPGCRSETVERVLEYLRWYQTESTEAEKKAWEKYFVEMQQGLLCETASAAYALDVKPLVTLTSRAIAAQIRKSAADPRAGDILSPYTGAEDGMGDSELAAFASTLQSRFRLQMRRHKKKQTHEMEYPLLIEGPVEDTRSVDDLLQFITGADGEDLGNAAGGGGGGGGANGKKKGKAKKGKKKKGPAAGSNTSSLASPVARGSTHDPADVPALPDDEQDPELDFEVDLDCEPEGDDHLFLAAPAPAPDEAFSRIVEVASDDAIDADDMPEIFPVVPNPKQTVSASTSTTPSVTSATTTVTTTTTPGGAGGGGGGGGKKKKGKGKNKGGAAAASQPSGQTVVANAPAANARKSGGNNVSALSGGTVPVNDATNAGRKGTKATPATNGAVRPTVIPAKLVDASPANSRLASAWAVLAQGTDAADDRGQDDDAEAGEGEWEEIDEEVEAFRRRLESLSADAPKLKVPPAALRAMSFAGV